MDDTGTGLPFFTLPLHNRDTPTTAAIVRRAVAMARACLPRPSPDALQLLFGEEPDSAACEPCALPVACAHAVSDTGGDASPAGVASPAGAT